MSRVRASDYELKTQAIMDSAAVIFARDGYQSTRMEQVARARGATKSMLYHYFPTKDELLLKMLMEHLEHFTGSVASIVRSDAPPAARLAALVDAYLHRSSQVRRRHMVAMQDIRFLPAEKRRPLVALQRRLVSLVAELVQEINPALPKRSAKPYALMLIGMLNWTDLWYRPDGPMDTTELCRRMSGLYLTGLAEEPC